MKNKEIQDLINFIKKSDLDDVSIETENYKIRVKKNQNKNITQPKKVVEEIIETTSEIQKPKPKQNKTKENNESNNHLIIKSPMIGTFYRASNPKSDPFIKEGDIISEGQTICIIEAMKLFNEIESEVSGKVIKILIDDASPVEYDQDLFVIDPK